MGFDFRPAARENAPLLIGLSGGTGSGKTYSAMRLAAGMAGDRRFAVVDTEAGRAKHYADRFTFDHGDLTPPFTPARYLDALAAADTAGYPVIVVDSMSHEWAGEGGILDEQERELDRMAGTDPRKRESCKVASWIKPKGAHKKFVQRLLQLRAHVVLCFRAEPKIEVVRDATGKMVIQEKHTLTGLHGWVPISEKNLPFELTASVLLMAERPGVPLPIKLQEQHRAFFPLDAPITEAAGLALAVWAKGAELVLDTAPLMGPAPPTATDPEQAWLKKILAVKTRPELDAVGEQIKATTGLNAEQLAALRAAVLARRKTVGGRTPAAAKA